MKLKNAGLKDGQVGEACQRMKDGVVFDWGGWHICWDNLTNGALPSKAFNNLSEWQIEDKPEWYEVEGNFPTAVVTNCGDIVTVNAYSLTRNSLAIIGSIHYMEINSVRLATPEECAALAVKDE